MTVGDIVTQLKYGELKSLALKDDTAAIVSFLNLGLIELYGRFRLVRGEQIINLVDGQSTYSLESDCALIEAVYDEAGEELSINEDDVVTSVFTPSYNTIQVPNAATGVQLSILYIQNPILLDPSNVNILTTEVPIPAQLIPSLLHYIGYRAHGSMNGDIKAENNTHLMRYESSVRRVKDLGLIRNDITPANVNRKECIDE